MRSIVLQGSVGLLLVGAAVGCTPASQAQCEKYCQYLFVTCASGPATETVATCEATCSEANPTVNGGTCSNVLTYYTCVLDDACSQLQGAAGADALQGCELEASCPVTVLQGNGSSSGNGNSSSSSSSSGSSGTTQSSSSSSSSSSSGSHTSNSSSSSSSGSHTNSSSSSSSGTVSSSSSSGLSSSSSSSGSSGTVPTIGMTCTPPAAQGDADPCAADSAGLACNLNSDQVTYSCSLPEEFEACLPTPGCGADPTGMICQNNSGFAGYVCVDTCTTSSQCPDELTSCQNIGGTNICYYDLCGPGSSPDGGVANGSTYYATCNSASTNDGVCLPFSESTGTLGICEAAGSLALGATGCAVYRTGSTSNLCGTTSVCIQDPSNNATLCSGICSGTVAGGPTCAAPTTCDDPSASAYSVCLESCTAGTTVCPTGQTCNATYAVCLP